MNTTKHFITLLFITFFCTALSKSVFAQDGSLDLTFGTDGIVITDIDIDNDYGISAAIQPDGKLLVAGTSVNGNNDRFALVRYNTDGTLDNSFDSDGVVITPIGFDADGQDVTVQSDGKIVVAGFAYSDSNGWDVALVRYNPNGSLDNNFGSGGIVVTTISAYNDYAYSIAIQSDGKIVVAGESYNGTDWDFALVRYNSDGTLDNSFDSDGIVTTPIGSGDDIGQSVVIQSDNKIIVAGYYYDSDYPNFALVRYNTDGSLDNSFDSDGIVTTSIGSSNFAHSVALQSDGKIVIAGDVDIAGNYYDFAVVRFNTDGSLDNNFGTEGKVSTPIGSTFDYAYDVVIQADGKILVSGDSENATNKAYEFAIVRYNTDGTLDNSFGSNGIVITPIESRYDVYGHSVAIQSDGKIVLAGDSNNGSYWDFTVIRYDNPTLSPVEVDLSLPTEFSLSQNYPNPFNPTTTISYSIPNLADGHFASGTNVKLIVYDVLGKEVAALVNRQQHAGNYQVNFDASKLSSGVYYYRLTAGNFIEAKKMLLMK